MAFPHKKLVCVLLIIGMAVVAPTTEAAISCGVVSKGLTQCLPYLKGRPGPSPGCCAGVKGLAGQAKTTADRQAGCRCIKALAGAVSGLVPANAASLPGKCGISIGYPISTSIDCSKVH